MHARAVTNLDRLRENRRTQEERPSCLACGAHIHEGEPTIQIRGALFHMRCAVYRRRMARR
jgi:hypothetical protein